MNQPRVAIPITDLWNAMQHEQQAQDRYAAAATGLVTDLEAVGVHVDRLRDLRRRDVGDRRALPVLLVWLARSTSPTLTADICYALGSRWARPEAAPALIAEYRRLDGLDTADARLVRAAVCTALERVADDAVWDGITAIADDDAYCAQRGMAVVALGNMGGHRDEAVGRLTALLGDQCVVVFAILGLAKLDAREALPSLLPLLAHDNPVVARVARRTVSRWATVSA